MVWLSIFPTLLIALLIGLPRLVLSGLFFFGIPVPNKLLSPALRGSISTKFTDTKFTDNTPVSGFHFMKPALLCFGFLHSLGVVSLSEQCFLATQCYAQSLASQDPAIPEEVEPPKEAYQHSEWRDIATGLQIKVVELSTGFLSGEITLLKTSLSHFRPQVVRAASFQRDGADVEWYSKQTGASACINAHFFDETGSPLGLVVSRGIEHKRMQLGGTLLTGFFLAYHKRLEIKERDKNHKGGLEAIQSGPRLVINGAVANDLDDINESRRSGICTTSPTEYILFVASSPFRGATLKELGDILSSPQIQCEDALNFDGGGSTQLFVRQNLQGAQVGFRGIHVLGRDEVPTVLCLFPAS